MTDFNYDIEVTDHYYIDDITVYGKSVQDGTPTPDAPVPVQVVKPLIWNQLVKNGNFAENSGWQGGSGVTLSISDNKLTVTGTTPSYLSLLLAYANYFSCVSGHKYLIAATVSCSSGKVNLLPTGVSAGGSISTTTATTEQRVSGIITAPSSATYNMSVRFQVTASGTSEAITGTLRDYICIDLTQAFGAGNEPSTVAEFELMFPESYYPYDAGSELFTLNCGGVSTPIDLDGNVLASLPDGTRDVLTIDSAGHVVLEKYTLVEDYDGTDMSKWSISSGTYPFALRTETSIPTSDYVTLSADNSMCSAVEYKSITSNGTYQGYSNTNRALRFRPIDNPTLETLTSYLQAHPTRFVLPLKEPQTIDLGSIELPSNSNEPYTVSVIASLTPETAINQTNRPTYEVENKYEHIPGAEMEIPPVHPMMQEWETFDPDNWDMQTMMDYTYQNEWHAVYTVYLGELMQSGVFDWSRPELDWSSAAFDDEQYQRVCDYFDLRFKWREISILPVLKWFDYLRNKLVYELMPKYKPVYERVAEGVNPLSSENEYYKNRTIQSAYPETLLSENSDYITDGKDEEFQRIKEKGTADAIVNFAEVYKGVDQLILDELEIMFVSLYTTNINGL